MKQSHKTVALWLSLLLMFLFVLNVFRDETTKQTKVSFSVFVKDLEAGKIEQVSFKGKDTILGKYKDAHNNGRNFITTGDTGPEIFKLVRENNLIPDYLEADKTPFWQQLLVNWGPILLLLFLFLFFMRQVQAGGGKAFSFGKSKAKLVGDKKKITFKDVAGCDEAKDELIEIVDFLKNPTKYTKLGAKIPKGVLLMGAPGTGKTLLARAVAGEAGVPFFTISGSDFVEMFVGVGASRVRDLFEQGKKNSPCIIFMDEIDAVGRHRGAGLGGGHDEREQTLNQLLVEMDGFEANDGVILIAATNRPDVLDPALLRPGRFDRRVVVNTPDIKGREEILKIHTAKKPIDTEVDFKLIARGTPGFTGADLENLANEAALIAAKENAKKIDNKHLDLAKDKVIMGSPRRSLIINEEDKKITAVHEAGHTIVAMLIKNSDPVHKVTIIPHGMAMGVTQILPQEDRHMLSKEKALTSIKIMLAGRVAEEIIFNSITTGASNDIERATSLARKMVCSWGMSDNLGLLKWGNESEHVFLGKDFSSSRNYSEDTARLIDNEIRTIMNEAHEEVKVLLTNNIDKLKDLTKYLIERETLSIKEVTFIMEGKALDKIQLIEEINDEEPSKEHEDTLKEDKEGEIKEV